MARITGTHALLLLMFLTLGTFAAFELQSATRDLGLAMFVIGMIKVQVIISYFMHLSWSHKPYRQVLHVWCFIVLLFFVVGVISLPWRN